MRGQVSLETIIVLAALAGVLTMLAIHFGNLADMAFSIANRKAVEYAKALIEDASNGCHQSPITLRFPFEVEIQCSPTELCIGNACAELDGIGCAVSGRGGKIRVKNCTIEII